MVIDAFPYALASTTEGAPSDVIDSYDCAAGTNESGPERVFRFSLPEPARVTAWVEGDGGSVDIDVHLLDDATLSGSQATSCLARGNLIAEADMKAGEHLVVVDSFGGAAQAGHFVLRVHAIGDSWVETTIAEGVTWRARRFADLSGAQVIHQLVVLPGTPGVSVRSVASDGCQTISALGKTVQGAVAGVNGGFFDMGTGKCDPVSMLKQDGVLLKANDRERGSFGITQTGEPLVEMVAKGVDWPEAYGAHGGGPMLAVKGVANNGQSAWSAQGFSDTGWNGVNPRTVAGVDADGAIHFFTADGRQSPYAEGLSLDDLAAFSVGNEMKLVDVVNLDGGGSTTFWVAGATPNGVVNYPSGGGTDNPEHGSQRAVSGGFFVVAPEYNHGPRFQTKPVTSAKVGVGYTYDADAIDLDVTDTVTFSLAKGPAGMSVEPATGVVTFTPPQTSGASEDVVLLASDQRGASTPQHFTLVVEGGQVSGPDAGADASEPEASLSDAAIEPLPESGIAADSGSGEWVPEGEDGGCGCELARRSGHSWQWGLAVLGLAAIRRRRRATTSLCGTVWPVR